MHLRPNSHTNPIPRADLKSLSAPTLRPSHPSRAPVRLRKDLAASLRTLRLPCPCTSSRTTNISLQPITPGDLPSTIPSAIINTAETFLPECILPTCRRSRGRNRGADGWLPRSEPAGCWQMDGWDKQRAGGCMLDEAVRQPSAHARYLVVYVQMASRVRAAGSTEAGDVRI